MQIGMPTSDAASSRSVMVTLGFIVNPLAGIGGRVGLKGSDGADVVREARARGATPLSGERGRLALRRLADKEHPVRVLTASGAMGEDAVRAAGLDPVVVHHAVPDATSAADTRAAATAITMHGVDLILFVGGDGTARDVLDAAQDRAPMLGVPAGVKMHSAVFGTTPTNAGHVAALYLARSPAARLRQAEVMDLDETTIRAGWVSAQLHGYARSPYERHLVQNAKAGSRPGEDAGLDQVAQQVVARMQPDCLYILGPGTTTRRVADALSLPSTLLGVDAILNGRSLGLDLDEGALLHLMNGREATIVVGVLGGQGSLFGRGNQQISAEVIRRVGRDRITILSTVDKLIALDGAALHVDTGDADVDAMLSGHLRIMTGPGRTMLFRVSA